MTNADAMRSGTNKGATDLITVKNLLLCIFHLSDFGPFGLKIKDDVCGHHAKAFRSEVIQVVHIQGKPD